MPEIYYKTNTTLIKMTVVMNKQTVYDHYRVVMGFTVKPFTASISVYRGFVEVTMAQV